MIKSTLKAFALSLFFITPSYAAESKHVAPAESPVALFKDIYGAYPASEAADAWHKADKSWLGKGSIETLPSWGTLPLSASTNSLNRRVNRILAKSRELCIDYDPISDSQDPNIAKYRIVGPTEPPAERAEYHVEMQGSWSKDVTKVTYLLVKEQGKWRVDDIVTYSTDAKGKPEKNSGREMLTACLKN